MPRRPGNIKDGDVYRELQTIYNILDILSPINPKAKNASIIQTNEGITTAQNISVEGAPNWEQIGAGVEPKSGLSLTIKSKTDIGTDTRAQNWRTSTGWGIAHEDGEYTQYIDNLVIKGWLKAKEFIIEQTRIRDANYLFTNGGIVEKTDGVSWFDVEDPNENHTASFEQYDIIECLQVNLTGASFTGGEIDDDDFLIKRLVFQVTSVDGVRVNVTTTAGAPANKGTIKKGDVFARVANTTTTSRQGLVGIFNDEENAPYFDIRGSLNSYAAYKSNSNLKLRLGKLDGITDAAFGDLSGSQTDLYGAYLAGNIYIKGSIQIANPGDIDTSDLNNDAGWTAGANWSTNLTGIPSTLGTPSGAGLYLGATYMGYYDGGTWKTYTDSSGNFYLGGTGGALTWAAGSNTLTITNGTINTPTLTGGIVQTAASGQRILMDSSNTIKFYKTGGTLVGSVYGGNIPGYGDAIYLNGDLYLSGFIGLNQGEKFTVRYAATVYGDVDWGDDGVADPYWNFSGAKIKAGSYRVGSTEVISSGRALNNITNYNLSISDIPDLGSTYLKLQAAATQTLGGTSYAYGFLFQRSDATNAPATFDQRGAGLLTDIRQGGTTKVSISNSGVLKAVGYQSSDGTSGATASVDPTGVSTLEFKNGLFIGTT